MKVHMKKVLTVGIVLFFCGVRMVMMSGFGKTWLSTEGMETDLSAAEEEEKAGEEGGTSKNFPVLVNASHRIPDDWQVDIVQLKNGQAIDSRAYPSLQAMMDEARAEGLEPYICSSYRSRETQQQLYQQETESWINQGYSRQAAEAKAAQWVAAPGYSEHELGLAVDIVSLENQRLDESQLESQVQQWLMEHCWEYGFVLRYPSDKSDITGIGFEPWHYRYVGKETAMEMKEKALCLEEYMDQ